MGKFAKLTSPPKIYYTLTYFLLVRYFFLNSQRNSGHLHQKVRAISQQFSKKNYVGHLRQKNKGPYLSNLPAKMSGTKKS